MHGGPGAGDELGVTRWRIWMRIADGDGGEGLRIFGGVQKECIGILQD